MTAVRHLTILPRAMQESAAAAYVGVSPSKLRTLPIPRRISGANRLYDRHDLDAWVDGLPYEGESDQENSCDAAFGLR
jgi:hypothetical protein